MITQNVVDEYSSECKCLTCNQKPTGSFWEEWSRPWTRKQSIKYSGDLIDKPDKQYDENISSSSQ